MTIIDANPDLNDYLESLLQRISLVEQMIADPAVVGGTGGGGGVYGDFQNVRIIDPATGLPVVVLNLVSDPTTGLTATAFGSIEDIYVEVTWVPPVTSAGSYEVELSIKNVSGSVTNLLTLNQESLETNTAGWAVDASSPAGTSIARVTTHALEGSACLAVTSGGVATPALATTGATLTAVTAGKQYTGIVNVLAETTARTVQACIAWFDVSSVFISRTALATGADNTATWTQLAVTDIAPPGAAFAAVVTGAQASPAAEVHNFDKISISQGVAPGSYLISQVQRTGGNSASFHGLKPLTTYGVRVYNVNPLGVLSNPEPSSGYLDVTTGVDTNIPATPGGIVAFSIPHGIVMHWTDVADLDVANGTGTYQIDVYSNSGGTVLVKSVRVSGTVASILDLTSNTPYWVKVTAITSSGTSGPPSALTAVGTAQVTGSDIAANTIVASNVFASSFTGNFFTAITVTASQLTAGSITAGAIALAGGSITCGSPPTTGVLINSQGIRLYSGGSLVVTLDASSGTATFKGAIASGSTISGTTINGGTINGGAITAGSLEAVDIRSNTYTSGPYIDIPATVYPSGSGNPTPALALMFNAGNGTDIAGILSDGYDLHLSYGSGLGVGNLGSGGLAVTIHGNLTVADGIVCNGGGGFAGNFGCNGSSNGFNSGNLTVNTGLVVSVGACFIQGVCNASSYATHSARASKTNLRPIFAKDDDIFAKIALAKPMRFNKKKMAAHFDEENHVDIIASVTNELVDNNDRIGFIAEDFVKIFPEVVHDLGGIPGIDYGALTPVLFEAIKRLDARVKELEGSHGK